VCKTALIRELELELDVERPLFVASGEIDKAHGFDLLAGALSALLKQDISLVIAGSGAQTLTKRFETAAGRHRSRFAWLAKLDDAQRRRLVAAGDFAIIPVRSAPSGGAELIAQRYGALPIAHATGSIRDTIVDVDAELDTGTGFLFDQDSVDALIGAVQRGVAAYRSEKLGALRRRVMRRDLSWDRPARRYQQIYRQTVGSTA
jgi:starch synthase